MRVIAMAVAVAVVTGLQMTTGCLFKECNSDYVTPMYRITVVDGATGSLICDASVTVDGATVDRSQVDCSYGGIIPEGKSTATVAASKAGYQSTSQDVSTDYDEDECGKAVAERVVLTLQPQ